MVLSCSVMDSGIYLRNPSLPFSSIPTCAVICNIWPYQPEMGGTENCSQRHLKRIAGWGRVAWLCFPVSTVSVNSICSPYFSGGGKRTKSSSSKLYALLASRSFAELFTPVKKKGSLWLLDFTYNPLCHQQAAKQLACTNNESCTLV